MRFCDDIRCGSDIERSRDREIPRGIYIDKISSRAGHSENFVLSLIITRFNNRKASQDTDAYLFKKRTLYRPHAALHDLIWGEVIRPIACSFRHKTHKHKMDALDLIRKGQRRAIHVSNF